MKRFGKSFKIGELAEIAQVSKRTIDYYTQIGLLQAHRADDSNYRYYAEESIEHLRLIELLKKQNLSLDEIKQRLNLLRDGSPSLASVIEKVDFIHEQMKMLEQHMLQLKPLLNKLNDKQLKAVTKSLSMQGMSFVHCLAIMLGENPFI